MSWVWSCLVALCFMTALRDVSCFVNSVSQYVSKAVSMFACTVRSSYSCSSIRLFNWTTFLVPKHWGEPQFIDGSMSNSAMVGGDIPPFSWLLLGLFYG